MKTDDSRLDQSLDRRLAALTRAHAPDPALWHGIEGRLPPHRRSRRLAIAAAVGGLALIVATLTAQLQREPLLDPGRMTVDAEAQALRALEPESIPAAWTEAAAGLESAWHDNQAAIAELEQALERSPGNRLLLDFLAQARLRQARLIGQAATRNSVPISTERKIDT